MTHKVMTLRGHIGSNSIRICEEVTKKDFEGCGITDNYTKNHPKRTTKN